MSETLDKNSIGIIIALACAAVFGLYPSMARLVYADGGNESLVVLSTTFTRAAALGMFCFLAKLPLFETREKVRQAMIGGLFQCLSILGIFSAVLYMPGALVIAVLFLHTIMLLFFLAWKREIELRPFMVVTTFFALISLTFVLDVWENLHGLSLQGLGFAAFAAIATASRLYVYQGQMEGRPPAAVGAENFLFAAFFTLAILVYQTPSLPATSSTYLYLFCACASLIVGTFGLFYGISYLGSFKFSLIIKLEPVFTALFGVLFAHEILKARQIAGIVFLVGNLAAFQLFDSARNSIK